MAKQKDDKLMMLLESFFRDYLIGTRGVSHHTVRAYRDTLRLFLCFTADNEKKDIVKLCLDDINTASVVDFLTYIEVKRDNAAASRNCRLAAIKSFIKHLVRNDLERVCQYQQILALPSKKTNIPIATYLEPDEVKLILKQPDRRTVAGLRHYALLQFLYNTGARVNELVSLKVGDLQLSPPRHALLHGKGKKSRFCPLWSATVDALKRLPSVQNGSQQDPVFCNRYGHTISRDGVAYILNKYKKSAEKELPTLRRRKVTPHSMRHSCAVALLQAGVDITVIRDYLGHSSITATDRYIKTNLKMKRDALEKFWSQSELKPVKPSPWKPKPDILNFLASL